MRGSLNKEVTSHNTLNLFSLYLFLTIKHFSAHDFTGALWKSNWRSFE